MNKSLATTTNLIIDRGITKNRKAEEQIDAWKNRYELLIEAFGQLVYEYDVGTGDIFWGACLEQVLGYSPDEIQGGIVQWEEMIHSEDRDKFLRMLKIAEKYLTPFDAQYRVRQKDGTYRWLHDRGKFMIGGPGKSMRLIGMIQDISARKKTEKELEESEARYHSLFKKNQAAMLMIDPETVAIVDANLGACVFYGYTYEKMLKLKITDINTQSAEEVKTQMQRALTEQHNHFYCQHRLANGQVRDIEVYNGPIFMCGKQLVYSIIHDITERKLVEEALQQSNDQLRELNNQKNEFLGMAAHDLRNPIAVIQNVSLILSRYSSENLSEKQQEFLRKIHNTSKFMLELLNHLLDISKIEAGKLELEITKNNYPNFVEKTIEFNRFFATEKSISMDLVLLNEIPPIGFDQNKIEQVLNNLISNAIKYSHPHTTITIGVLKEKGFVVTKVIDQGQGIPQDELPHVFKAFQKTSTKPTAGEKSTGLGLAIVKKIVEGHQGEIGVESEVGKGSTFFFKLPLLGADCVSGGGEERSAEGGESFNHSFR
jgi:two-component system cell cycle sensor histidine kinase PleC